MRVIFLLFMEELLGGRGALAQRLDQGGCLLQHFRIAPARQHTGEPPQEIDRLRWGKLDKE